MISILIPANNEERCIGPCLDALLAQETDREAEIIVAANACQDRTVELAESYGDTFRDRGWHLAVLDIAEGGKPNALNRADAAANGDVRIYLDADVVISPPLVGALAQALDCSAPAYASGKLVLAPAQSRVTRAYGRMWARLPFMTQGVPGAGLFAVNAAGRARWREFPGIISDDTFVRLQFAPEERIGVAATYQWPLVEGLAALVRVRRRQDLGVAEVYAKFPDLERNAQDPRLGPGAMALLFLKDPPAFAVYTLTRILAGSTSGSGEPWARGR